MCAVRIWAFCPTIAIIEIPEPAGSAGLPDVRYGCSRCSSGDAWLGDDQCAFEIQLRRLDPARISSTLEDYDGGVRFEGGAFGIPLLWIAAAIQWQKLGACGNLPHCSRS
jgi:hypothetical protein